MRFLGMVFISLLSTQVQAKSFEDRTAFKCKEKYLDMGKQIGYKSPAFLYRSEDGTYFSSYEKLAEHLKATKSNPILSLQGPKMTNASFIVFDKSATSENQIKESSMLILNSLNEKKANLEYQNSGHTRWVNDYKKDRLTMKKPRTEEEKVAYKKLKDKRAEKVGSINENKAAIAALDVQIEKVKNNLPNHFAVEDSVSTSLFLAEAKSNISLNVGEKCEIRNLHKGVNPCQNAQAAELCGSYTGLIAFDQKGRSGPNVSGTPAATPKSGSASSVKSQN